MERPLSNEYIPYYERYVKLVPEGDIITLMEQQLVETIQFLKEIPEEKSYHKYADGKWSIKEVVGHINDSERIFSYRALRFARNDQNPLAGYEQDDYVAAGNFDKVSFADLIEEFFHIRKSSIFLFKNMDEAATTRIGIANNDPISVRALAYNLVGHIIHHTNIINQKYLLVSSDVQQ